MITECHCCMTNDNGEDLWEKRADDAFSIYKPVFNVNAGSICGHEISVNAWVGNEEGFMNFYVDTCGDSVIDVKAKINYCPVCGRKLNKEKN